MFSVFKCFVLVLQCDAFVAFVLSDESKQSKDESWSTANQLKPPQ